MALPVWPASVPHQPLVGTLQIARTAEQPLVSEMNSGTTRRRRKYTINVAQLSFEIMVTNAQLGTFTSFYDTTLGNGSSRFDMLVFFGGVFSTFSALFAQPPSYVPIPGTDRTRVSISLLVENLKPPFAPANTAAPTITGAPLVGETLIASSGTWTGSPTPTLTYQWLRGGVDIFGATAAGYTLVTADVGAIISVRVTATNIAGSASATSSSVGPVTISGMLLDFTVSPLDSRITFSRTSHATMYDSTGKLTYAPNNLLLNTATLATQSVTSAPNAYILSFKGTGTVTKSGTATGALAGTGVAVRVSEKFTPTDGSLTLTVSGSVTEAQLEAVTYETTPRTYNATTTAAYYGPRVDYDPVTPFAARGLLIEDARTNLLTYSNTFSNAAWSTQSCTVLQNAVGPEGVNSAWSVTETGTTTVTTTVYTAGPALTGTARTGSVFVKKGSQNFVNIAASAGFGAQFNLNTGVVVATHGASVTAGIANIGGGIYRCSVSTSNTVSNDFLVVSASTGVAIATVFGVDPYFREAYPQTASIPFYIYGAQLEPGAFATSYIHTTTASVTRAADSASMTGTNFSSWYVAAQGTFVVEFSGPAVGTRGILAVNDATANEQMRMLTEALDPMFRVADGGIEQAAIDAGAVAASMVYKFGAAYAVNDFAAAISGGAAVTDIAGTLPTVTQMQIGSDQAGNYLNGHIKSVTYYNTRRSNAALTTLTGA